VRSLSGRDGEPFGGLDTLNLLSQSKCFCLKTGVCSKARELDESLIDGRSRESGIFHYQYLRNPEIGSDHKYAVRGHFLPV
jgi:hypothetical protein